MKMNVPDFVTKALKVVKKNSPEILTALGVSGVVTTAYLAAKASAEVARDEDADPFASNKEKLKKYWKVYIPTGVSGVLTIGCIVGASKATGKRTAAAVTAYSITEKAFSEYKEKVIEQIGVNKEKKLRDEIAQDRVSNKPASKEVIVLGGGDVLCCELFTHRYFRSDMETLRKAQNDINMMINQRLYVPLDEFYDLIGLPHTSNSANLGWDSDKLLELKFSTVLSVAGEPCLAFDYNYTKPL